MGLKGRSFKTNNKHFIMAWFVLYTKSHNEKKVAESLTKQGIEVFCPTIKKERKWSDRIKVIEVPLFKSYCFVNLEDKDRQKVFGVSGVVRYLFWLKKPAIVKQEEINIIKDLLNEFDHTSIEVVDFQIDDTIVINSGVFSGKDALITNKQGKKIVVKIESLKMFISIDLSINKIKKKDNY